MHIKFSADASKDLKRIKKADRKLFGQVKKQLKLFTHHSKHPSLRLHKLTGRFHNRWSISINRSIRLVYIQLNINEIYVVGIGTHDEVYRK